MLSTPSVFMRQVLAVGCFLVLTLNSLVYAQEIPDIPNSVQFGGINVKFDNGAKRVMEADIRSLMANKRFWEYKMDRAVLYFPILEGVLIEEEVPLDFKYLAVQESSLTPDAVSTSDAVGFWQFKKETAQELGLLVDSQVDERKSITASTRAAARYLKRSNAQFNNWVSALYSYYLGMGGISQLVPANWAYAKEVTLDGKTDKYVLRFFAHKIALEAGLERHRTANTIVLLEYRNGRGRTFDAIAREMELDPLEVRRYNRWMETNQIPADRDYVVALPVASDKINVVREKLALNRQDVAADFAEEDIGFPVLRKASVQLKGSNDPVFYEINSLPGIQARPGDQADVLAKAAKISTKAFLKYNDLSSGEPLVAGEVYYLAKKSKRAMVPFHTVREGETIRGISQIYGLRTKELMKYNRIMNKNLRLQTGRVMWLTKKRPANKPFEVIEQPARPKQQNYPQPELIGATTADIPQNASERRKYKPKLADETAAPAPEPATEQPQPSTPARETPVAVATSPAPSPAPVAKPAGTSKSTSTSSGNNDRIVIISQEEDPSMREFDSEPTPTPRKTTPPERTPEATPTARATTSPARSTPTTSRSTPASSEIAQYHTVTSGQTYYSISRMYNIDVKELLEWNNLSTDNTLQVGKQLLVQAPSAASSRQAPATTTSGYITHTVVSGETLYRISKNYGVSMAEIQRINNLNDGNVRLGEKLKIPRK